MVPGRSAPLEARRRFFGQTSPSRSKDASNQIVSDPLKIAGKTFDQWVKELHTKDPSKTRHCHSGLLAFPPQTAVKALPALLAEMKKHTTYNPVDLSVRCSLCLAFTELFGLGEKIDPKIQAEAVTVLRPNLRDSQAILKFRSLVALRAIGPDARSAIPDITALLGNRDTWEVRQAAAGRLGAIAHDGKNGPPIAVLKSLYGLLDDHAYQVRLGDPCV